MNKALRGVAQAVAAAALLHAGVVAVRAGSRPSPVPLLAEEGGAIEAVEVHFAPDADFAHATYADFFRRLPKDVRVYVAVERPEHADEFERLTGRDAVPVVVGKPITTWARDRFAAGRDGAIVVPPEPQPGPRERRNDWFAPFALARALGVETRTAPFRFDGGDFTVADGRVIATSTWAARNPERTPAELVRLAEGFFGQPVVYLPDAPEHHVGMALAPVGGRTVLVGDARWGARLCADAAPSEEAARRFDGVAEALTRAGFRVERIPVLPTSRGYVWLTYTNAIVEAGVVYMPVYGRAELDAAAAAVWARLGFDVRRVDVSRVYGNGGTLHCLVHVLRRSG